MAKSPFNAIGPGVVAIDADLINKPFSRETSLMRYGRAISLVSLLYGVNVVFGLVRDSALAATLGASEQLDALLLGLNFVRNLALQMALVVATALIPLYVPLVGANEYQALARLTGRWVRHSLVILIPVSVLLIFFSPFIANLLGPGLSESGRATLSQVLAGLSPLLIILCCAGTTKAMSESYGVYVAYPILLGLMSVGLIAGVLAAPAQWKVQGAVAGVVLGSGIGLGIQILLIARKSSFYQICRRLLSLRKLVRSSDNLQLPYKSMLLLLGSSLLVLWQGLIERAYLSQLPSGSVVTYSLALSVIGVPTALLLPAISAVLLPHLVRQENNSRRKYGLSLKEFGVLIGIFGIITCLFWLFSDPLTQILFLRGHFSTEATSQTAQALRWISLAFISYVLGAVLKQVLIARQLLYTDFYFSCITLLTRVLLLHLLVPVLGTRGVALEALLTSILYVTLCFGALRFDGAKSLSPS